MENICLSPMYRITVYVVRELWILDNMPRRQKFHMVGCMYNCTYSNRLASNSMKASVAVRTFCSKHSFVRAICRNFQKMSVFELVGNGYMRRIVKIWPLRLSNDFIWCSSICTMVTLHTYWFYCFNTINMHDGAIEITYRSTDTFACCLLPRMLN